MFLVAGEDASGRWWGVCVKAEEQKTVLIVLLVGLDFICFGCSWFQVGLLSVLHR